MPLSPKPRVHAAHRGAHHEPEMIDAETLTDQAVLGFDHVHVAVVGETGPQSVAWLTRLAVTDAVGKDQEIPLGIEESARAEQLTGETRTHVLCSAAAGAVEDEHGVADRSFFVAFGLATRLVVQPELEDGISGGGS